MSRRFQIVDLGKLRSVACPCGTSRRGFSRDGAGMTLHLVRIRKSSRTHYHKRLTEIYYFLQGRGRMELDGRLYPVRPGVAVLVRPGTRHRALPGKGRMTILNFVVPAFDPKDEWFE